MKLAHLLFLTTALSSGLAYGQMSGISMPASPAAPAATSSKMTEGKVLKVDLNHRQGHPSPRSHRKPRHA